MLKLYLIRHGQTPGNKLSRYIGTTDEPLSDEGREFLKKLSYPMPEELFVSPLLRCVETAEIFFPGKQLHIIEELSECNFGEFENKNYKELAGNENYQKWIDSNGTLPFPEGEGREDFVKRNAEGFADMMRDAEEQLSEQVGKHIRIGAVVHGGTIMSVLSAFGDGGYFDYQVKNGDGWRGRVKQTEEGFRITDLEKLKES